MSRSQLELEAAARRILTERPIRTRKAAALAGVSEATICSWIVRGRQGVFLDGLRRENHETGDVWWLTSEPALFRFTAQRLLKIPAAGEALAAECGQA